MKRIMQIGFPAIVLAGIFWATNGSVQAQSYYTHGHGDLGIEYEAGGSEFEPHWHLHADAVVDGVTLSEEQEYATSELIARTTATSTALTGSATWLGVEEGTAVFRLGSESHEPELGFGTEELLDTDWLNATITLTLTGWSASNPGQVALLSGTAPGFEVYASTFDFSNDNSWTMDAGGHSHPVWLFSEAGTYELEFTWSATYIGEGSEAGGTVVSGTGTYVVEAVPEPGTWMLMSLGAVALVMTRARRNKNQILNS